MITTTIDMSKVKDFNMFKNLIWREATQEEQDRVFKTISEIKKLKSS